MTHSQLAVTPSWTAGAVLLTAVGFRWQPGASLLSRWRRPAARVPCSGDTCPAAWQAAVTIIDALDALDGCVQGTWHTASATSLVGSARHGAGLGRQRCARPAPSST